ncbi:hypothetical protein SODALDRAFT_308846 [Sodiomyces alkalinus F11]|uniref:DNA-directed RNA polymerase III subunit RPC6 n=1 Tax=Sodiomyces alkalinus (strain CBS 110278 / VKM F-3762 / F11) TaxID=1314773 RepID=A0A3N2PY78_SODAK|nr:hypothetical protein SODALDRAFT_308846 [Sodiomyces alkalinus F11]ROT39493.1 hypothetical protein SODALDRAFT_308846 [Sodiomyces alkalinus F11]
MASESSSSAAPAATTPASAAAAVDPSKFDILKQALYDACRSNGDEDNLYSQYDLLDLGIIPNRDPQMLLKVVQSLTNDKLLIAVSAQGGLAWRWRPRAEADKYKLCTTDEQRMVYGAIDDAGADGIWTKTIQGRLGINDAVMKTALKQLQSKNLIAPFKSVEHTNKKMYIKASLRPSERATGGPWFTDQALDVAFIEDLQRVIFDYIKRQSSYFQKGHSSSSFSSSSSSSSSAARTAVPKKGILKGSAAAAAGKKRTAEHMSGDHDTNSHHHHHHHHHHRPHHNADAAKPTTPKNTYLPLPAGYKEYPTVRDMARFISQSGITTETILGEEDVQKLIDVLVFDNLIEAVRVAGRVGYRVRRHPKQSLESWAAARPAEDEGVALPVVERGAPEPVTNGFTEAPCGRCPVFELCEEGGPVSASNCIYFQRWLGLEE